MKIGRKFTDEQLDTLVDYLEGDCYILYDAIKEVLGVSFEEITHEDYKYLLCEIFKCFNCGMWFRESDAVYTYEGMTCEECARYLEEEE